MKKNAKYDTFSNQEIEIETKVIRKKIYINITPLIRRSLDHHHYYHYRHHS